MANSIVLCCATLPVQFSNVSDKDSMCYMNTSFMEEGDGLLPTIREKARGQKTMHVR